MNFILFILFYLDEPCLLAKYYGSEIHGETGSRGLQPVHNYSLFIKSNDLYVHIHQILLKAVSQTSLTLERLRRTWTIFNGPGRAAQETHSASVIKSPVLK
jgi:hypothetical protein